MSQANSTPSTATPPRHPREGGDPASQPNEESDLFWGISKEKIWLPIFLTLFVVVLWSFSAFTLNNDGYESRGTFGDMFGAINALFSGLAFAGIIYTILLQSKELKLQREDLALTRAEIEGQKLELKQQNETLKIQRFENTLFNLLSQHNHLIESFKVGLNRDNGLPSAEGKAIFPYLIDFQNRSLNDRLQRGEINAESIGTGYITAFQTAFKHHGHYLSLYFKSLFCMLNLVELSQNTPAEKIFYVDIIKSQLNNSEILVILIYLISNREEPFFKLAEKYALLEGFELQESMGLYLLSRLLNKEFYKDEYPDREEGQV